MDQVLPSRLRGGSLNLPDAESLLKLPSRLRGGSQQHSFYN